MILANRTDIESEIRSLSYSDLDEPEFVELLGKMMASSCDAIYHWMLIVDGPQTEVLSDDDSDFTAYQVMASRHEDFNQMRDQAVKEKRITVLQLDSEEDLTFGQGGSDRSASFDPLLHTNGCLFFVPIHCKVNAELLVCLYCELKSDTDIPAVKRQLTLLSMLGDMRINIAKTQEVQEEASRQQLAITQSNTALQEALELSNAVSANLDKEKSGYVLANELRRFLGVDRVTVVEQVGSQSRLLAISGQATFNRRSNIVRSTRHLAKTVLKSGQPLWFEGDQDSLAGPVQQAVSRYVDESLVQGFALIPIHESVATIDPSDEEALVELVNPQRTGKRKLRGAILIESVQNPMDFETIQDRWGQVERHVTSHFNNTKRYSDIFLLPLMLLFTRLVSLYRGHKKRTAWGMTLMATALIAAGLLIKTDFLIRCEGYLQPEKLHHVFVRKDGIVMDVLVKEGQVVKQGDALVNLQNRDLDFELASLSGELSQKQQAKENLIYKRLDYMNNDSARNSGPSYDNLAEQTGLLEREIEAIEKTLSLKKQQKEDLIVRAPFDGQVMGWNVDRKFLNRPLDQGTRLFSVAQNDEQHLLELKVPDQRSGYIASAWRDTESNADSLAVEFSIASLPDQRFSAEVIHVNPGLEQDSDLGYVLPIEARPDSQMPSDLRAGTPIVAKVVCGQKSFLYCKTYEFIDYVHRKAFEYVL